MEGEGCPSPRPRAHASRGSVEPPSSLTRPRLPVSYLLYPPPLESAPVSTRATSPDQRLAASGLPDSLYSEESLLAAGERGTSSCALDHRALT